MKKLPAKVEFLLAAKLATSRDKNSGGTSMKLFTLRVRGNILQKGIRIHYRGCLTKMFGLPLCQEFHRAFEKEDVPIGKQFILTKAELPPLCRSTDQMPVENVWETEKVEDVSVLVRITGASTSSLWRVNKEEVLEEDGSITLQPSQDIPLGVEIVAEHTPTTDHDVSEWLVQLAPGARLRICTPETQDVVLAHQGCCGGCAVVSTLVVPSFI